MLLQARQLRVDVSKDCYDTAAWEALIAELKSGLPLMDETRLVFEEVVATFPTKASHEGTAQHSWYMKPGHSDEQPAALLEVLCAACHIVSCCIR